MILQTNLTWAENGFLIPRNDRFKHVNKNTINIKNVPIIDLNQKLKKRFNQKLNKSNKIENCKC